MVAAITLIQILNHLFPTLMFEIHIDIGRFAAFDADETLEQHIGAGRIDGGDAQTTADGGMLLGDRN